MTTMTMTMTMTYDLRNTVLATVAYGDALSMPLTATEAWRGLVRDQGSGDRGQEVRLAEIFHALQLLREEEKIGERWGYYCLPGREHLVAERLWRMRVADEKWKKLLRIVRWLRYVPFLRAVMVTGSLAHNNTREDSDYDALLITAPGRIFTARFFTTFVLKMLRVYRSDVCVADHVCPNHYITEQSLTIPFRSLYTAHIFATCVRVWSVDKNILEKFLAANAWIGEYLQGVPAASHTSPCTLLDAWYAKILRGAGEVFLQTPLGFFFEKIMRKVQLSKIAANPKTKDPGSGHVVANDEMLAFHPNSPEQGILEKYRKNLALSGSEKLDKNNLP